MMFSTAFFSGYLDVYLSSQSKHIEVLRSTYHMIDMWIDFYPRKVVVELLLDFLYHQYACCATNHMRGAGGIDRTTTILILLLYTL